MKPVNVPKKWVNVGHAAMVEVQFDGHVSRATISAIIAAVAPLIAAAERERITAILEAQAAGWERARLGYRDRGDAEMATYIGSKEGALDVALAAIRATPPEDGGKP